MFGDLACLCLGILLICNLWINFIFMDLFAVKVDGSDVIVGTPECFTNIITWACAIIRFFKENYVS